MKNSPVLWTIRQIRNRIPALVLMTAAQVGNALLAVLFALGSRGVIDSAVTGDAGAFREACLRQGLIILGILVCLTVMRHLRDRIGADLERDWKQRLLRGLLHGKYADVSRYHSGELVNRLNNDVAKVNDGILTIVPSAAAMLTRLMAAILVLGMLDADFTALILTVGLGLIVSTTLLRRKLKELNKRVSEQDGKVSGFLQEILEKLLMVQAMDVSGEVEHRSDNLLEERYQLQRKRKNVSLFANTGISVLYYGAGFLALTWCSFRLLQGQMSFGSLTAVIQLVNQLQTPFVNLSGVLPKYAAMTASAERLMELEQIQGEPVDTIQTPAEIYRKMETLCAEGLAFSFDRERIFEDVGFSLPKGFFAVVTGPSGIGKSTLLKLLLGIFQPEQGQLYLDCGGERLLLDRSTRGLFAYVPQENLLLSGTLRDNLTLVRPEATEEEIRQVVYISAMDEFLSGLPLGLDTPLGENGAGLSEGQAQRLSIARAVLGGAPILLLDECTSALDAETEAMVLQRLMEMPERTCIAVTHRPAAVQLCQWQLKVENGKIHTVKRK